jgi:hypothetical protein
VVAETTSETIASVAAASAGAVSAVTEVAVPRFGDRRGRRVLVDAGAGGGAADSVIAAAVSNAGASETTTTAGAFRVRGALRDFVVPFVPPVLPPIGVLRSASNRGEGANP